VSKHSLDKAKLRVTEGRKAAGSENSITLVLAAQAVSNQQIGQPGCQKVIRLFLGDFPEQA